jgi:hypothetical protein
MLDGCEIWSAANRLFSEGLQRNAAHLARAQHGDPHPSMAGR